MFLDIEARIGELLPTREKAMSTTKDSPSSSRERVHRPLGISEKRAHHARAISEHPDIVECVKVQAREIARATMDLFRRSGEKHAFPVNDIPHLAMPPAIFGLYSKIFVNFFGKDDLW